MRGGRGVEEARDEDAGETTMRAIRRRDARDGRATDDARGDEKRRDARMARAGTNMGDVGRATRGDGAAFARTRPYAYASGVRATRRARARARAPSDGRAGRERRTDDGERGRA
jgi:hypothetical protein